MKKGLIFIGAAETGKTRTAIEISKYFGDECVNFNIGRRLLISDRRFLSCCKPSTKILIFDEITNLDLIIKIENAVTIKSMINEMNGQIFQPELEKLIIICDSDIKLSDFPQDESFQKRFTILEFPNVKPKDIINEFDGLVGKTNLRQQLSFLNPQGKPPISLPEFELFKSKAEKYDELETKIARCYVNENGDELSEEESEGIDLCTIGEIAASHFGWI